MSESDLYGELMIEATRLGHRLFRNNVGRAKYRSPQSGEVYTVPYGVGGKGGSDMIGFTIREFHDADGMFSNKPMIRAPIFTAIEGKWKGRKPTKEQLQFLEAVRAAGGIAGVVESVEDYRKLIGAAT